MWIKWLDHFSSDRGWHVPEEFKAEPYSVESVGILVNETKDYITIATNVARDGQVSCFMSILKKGILEKRVLA